MVHLLLVMAHLHIETPLFESRPLTLRTGKEIWLKFESMQPTGSFKIRGIGEGKGYCVVEGTETEISIMTQQYTPIVGFETHPVMSVGQVEEMLTL